MEFCVMWCGLTPECAGNKSSFYDSPPNVRKTQQLNILFADARSVWGHTHAQIERPVFEVKRCFSKWRWRREFRQATKSAISLAPKSLLIASHAPSRELR
eukprot:6182528-Pleurochrysis_carterae.AAC.1